MDAGLELGANAIDHVAENHGEKIYDKVANSSFNPLSPSNNQSNNKKNNSSRSAPPNNDDGEGSRRGAPHHHRHRAELPSPERDTFRDDYYYTNNNKYTHSDNIRFTASDRNNNNNNNNLEQQSANSDQVLRDYENETDDRRRRPTDFSTISTSDDPYHSRRGHQHRERSYGRASHNMSHAYDDRRGSSQQPPTRSRHYDEDEYGSDYEDRNGRRTRTTGRGYDPDTGREYDREIIETERYRGPPRDWGDRRSSSYQENGNDYAVAQYKNGSGDLAPYDTKRRSRSRGRRSGDGFYDDDSRDYYDRDHDHEHHHHGHRDFREKVGDTFDSSPRGIGVGIAGALVGGFAGRQLGKGEHSKRDMVIGALIGGLGANAAERKWHDWKEEKELEREEDDRYENREYRSRSAMR